MRILSHAFEYLEILELMVDRRHTLLREKLWFSAEVERTIQMHPILQFVLDRKCENRATES